MKSRLLLVLSLVPALAPSAHGSDPAPGKPSSQTYQVRWLPGAKIQLDGRLDEAAWQEARLETHFVFPWEHAKAPATEFRALCDGASFYFSFRITDKDVVVLDRLRDEEDEVFEDRAEVYLSRDDAMRDYYCFEIDSRGRVFDYRASFYRKFETTWKFEGLETSASALPDGYQIEGRIPLNRLEALGFPRIQPGAKIRCGIFRAEFSHDRSGRVVAQKETLHNLGRKIEGPPPIEQWISWIDPKRPDADFHVPACLGWLKFEKP
jgi:Carbohydrate family 9 binding domain-like